MATTSSDRPARVAVHRLLLADDVDRARDRTRRRATWCSPGVGVNPAAARSATRRCRRARPGPSAGSSSTSSPRASSRRRRNNEVLQVVFWSVLFAVALTQVKGRPKEIILGFAEGIAEVMFKFVAIIMRYAPIGIGAAMAVTVGHSGLDVIVNLGKLVLTLYGALLVFVLVALIPAALIARIPIGRVRPRGEGPRGHRVHDDQLGRGAAARHAADDRVRGPQADRGIRHADRLLVQSGWVHALPRRGVAVRGPGGGDPPRA